MKNYTSLRLDRTRTWWSRYWKDAAMGAVIGASVFLLLYGVVPLNPRCDGWIYNGYIEDDIIQSYAGWQYMRQDAWHIPLCWANNVAAPTGASMAYTDVYPLAAVFFKLLGPILPMTFQYFGIVNFLNFCLQGVFAMLLLRLFSEKRSLCALGAVLFCIAPVFIERAFRHTALGSQWIILMAIYLYFKMRRMQKLPWLGFFTAACLAPAIHAYFVPMVYALLGAALLEDMVGRRRFWRPLGCGALCLAGTLLFIRGFGVIVPGGGSMAGSYGVLTMNLNALWNPTSFDYLSRQGFLKWSSFIPVSPQLHYNYDGFNYLGLGVLAALLGLGCYAVYRLIKETRLGKKPWRAAGCFCKAHLGLLLACLCMTLFAVSNVVSFQDRVILQIPLPQFLTDVFGMFRSSGRIFWPVGYLLLLAVWTLLARIPRKSMVSMGLLSLLVFVQTADIWPALAQKHGQFASRPQEEATLYNGKEIQYFAETYPTVRCLGTFMDYRLAAAFIRYNPQTQTNLVFFNRGTYTSVAITYQEMWAALTAGAPLDKDTVYLCSGTEACRELMQNLHPEARGYRVADEETGEGYYFFCVPRADMPDFLKEKAERAVRPDGTGENR